MLINSQMYSVQELFGLKTKARVLGYQKNSNPYIPKSNTSYVFQDDFIRAMSGFLSKPCGDSLFVTGPTGSGKTTGVLEFASRLNWPVQQVTANAKLEASDLIGMFTLQSEVLGGPVTTKFVYGPLATAMKEGHILLINEIDSVDPSELIALNDVFDGKPLIISQNGGEVIQPHAMFRVIVTGNTTGSGDDTGFYQGTVQQSLAFMDRFRMIAVNYLDEHSEFKLLSECFALPSDILSKMVRLAGVIRDLFLNGRDTGQAINTTMSTRTLLRWARLACDYKGAPNSIEYALQISLLNKVNVVDRNAIERLLLDFDLKK